MMNHLGFLLKIQVPIQIFVTHANAAGLRLYFELSDFRIWFPAERII